MAKIVITVEVPEGAKVTVGEGEEETLPKKRGRKAKAEVEETDEEEVEETEEDEDAEEEDDAEESDDEDADEEEDAEEEDDAISPEQLVKLKKALRAFQAKTSREKAVKTLNKFAKASQDVKASDYGKLMKLLK